eukprot:s351_g7.t1
MSPSAAQVPMDGAEMARRILQAAEAAASAATTTAQAIQLFKQQAESGGSSSLGILNALMGWKEFDMKVSLISQIVKLEEAYREYDKISLQPLAAEMKFAILLRCIIGQLRMHINVALKEDATYDALREMVLQYDRANIKWTEAMSLGTSRPSDDGGPLPMDIDRVKGKSKDKGKKGKTKGKDFKGKGKSQRADGGKSKGKDKGKGKDLWEVRQEWRRIIQVDLNDLEDEPMEPVVNMVRMIKSEEIYDLTYSDSDSDWCVCGSPEDGEPAYFLDYTSSIMKVSEYDLVANGSSPLVEEKFYMRGVTLDGCTSIVLDSGADMSVLPMKFKDVGLPLSRKSILRDAQGNRMEGGALREAVVELMDNDGNKVCLKETFALPNVMEPLLALGKMIRKGWKVEGQGGEVRLSYKEFNKVLESRNNSLVTQATIRVVDTEKKEVKVRAVTMSFAGLMRDLVEVPGWHLSLDRRVPFLVVHNTKNYKDSYPQFNRNDFPFRTTIIKKGPMWEVVEVAERRQDEGGPRPCRSSSTKS